METSSNGEKSGEIKLGSEVLKARGMSIALANGNSELFEQIKNDEITFVNTDEESDIETNVLTISQLCKFFSLTK